MKKFTIKNTEQILKEKTLLFATWMCENNNWEFFKSWSVGFNKLFKEVILFDPRKKTFELGQEAMKKKFFEIVGKQKPDYVLLLPDCGDFGIGLIEKINKISPLTKTIVYSGDDDFAFELSSRYYALFVDYYLVAQTDYIHDYKKDGLKNTMPFYNAAIINFKPLNLKKKYDVSFIGSSLAPRIPVMKYLIDKKVNVGLWGHGWINYPEFKKVYKGIPNGEEFAKIVNQSKINISFSKNDVGEPHFKARVLECAATKSFQLIDYFPGYLKYFKENEEIVMFKDKEDLTNKIKYYLSHEKEREEIAEKAYRKTIEEYSFSAQINKVFQKILMEESTFSRKNLPKINKKVAKITKEIFINDRKKIEEDLKKVSYVYFSQGKQHNMEHRVYLQAYSLEKTKKEISCCDYSIYSKYLGDYLVFKTSRRAIENLKKKEFNKLLNINQFLVSKKYFLENFQKFKKIFEGKEIDFVNKENTAFIDIPLVRIGKLPKGARECLNGFEKEKLEKAFYLSFLIKISHFLYQKSPLFLFFTFHLVVLSLINQDIFILKNLFASTVDKNNWSKLKNAKEAYCTAS